MDHSSIDLQDLQLAAQAEFDEAVGELMEELVQPLLERAIAMRWATLTDDQKEMIKQAYPDIYAEIMK